MAIFTCDDCKHEIRSADEHIGKSGKCPSCNGRGQVTPDPPEASSHTSPRQIPPVAFDTRAPKQSQYITPHIATATVPALPAWASVIIALTFGLLGVLTAGGALLLLLSLASANGAPQEAAAGAMFSAFFIAGYIISRSVEKVVRAMARR